MVPSWCVEFIFISLFLSTSDGFSDALRFVASSQLWNFIGFSLPISSLFSLENSSLKSSDMHYVESEVKR